MIIALDERQPCQNDAICSHSIHIVSVETEFPYSARRAMTKFTAAQTPSPHFSPGSRKQAQDSCSKAPLWSEKRSNGYGLSEEQAYGHED